MGLHAHARSVARLPRRLLNRTARLAVMASLATALVAPASTLGWANNGDGYGTHDWLIDQAVKVLDGRADGWFDAALARLHSDDPDKERDRSLNEHVYRGEGRNGGGVDRIAYHYDLAQAAYQAGNYDEASMQIGLMGHYVADLAEPYHTAIQGIPLGDSAQAYEQLVAPLHTSAGSTPGWSSGRRTVSEIANVRLTAAGTAAYSRQFWKELHERLTSNGFRLSSRVSEITGLVFKRAANDLADMIWSISRGVGAQPAIGRIKMDIRWTGIRPGDNQLVDIRALDVHGRPIEGLLVFLEWPTPTGVRIERMYTLPDGRAKRYGTVGTSPRLVLRPVTATAEVRGVETVTRGGWTLSPPLAAGRAGFKTIVNDDTVVAGQVVTMTSIARDGDGDPVPNLLVTWVWDLGATKLKTKGYTDADGRARSSLTVTVGMARDIGVLAKTQSGSTNRSSSTSFRRVD
jgi:hypothetical protein